MKTVVLNCIDLEALIYACEQAEEESKDVLIRLSCTGTCSIYEAMAVYDYLKIANASSAFNVHMEIVGMVGMLDLLILTGIDPDKRGFSVNSHLNFWKPNGFTWGTAEEAKLAIEARLEQVSNVVSLLAQNTEYNKEEIEEMMEKGTYLNREDLVSANVLGGE